jgi:cytochrome c553
MLRLFALVLMAGASSASADDLAERAAVCFSCHGEGGQSYNAETPSLGAERAPSC